MDSYRQQPEFSRAGKRARGYWVDIPLYGEQGQGDRFLDLDVLVFREPTMKLLLKLMATMSPTGTGLKLQPWLANY